MKTVCPIIITCAFPIIKLQKMIKCQHNEQIKLFCMRSTCQHTQVGGCEQCFLLDKSHIGSKDVIEVEEVQRLMGRYTFPKSVKPECVNLQDSFYTYFKKMQNEMKEIIVTIDEICKNVVNTIGFPYICFKNHFTVYKRIKNKEYHRISLAEFQKFITETKEVQVAKLAEMEEKLYLKEVNNFHEMIREIDHMMATFENLTKYYDQKTKFIHDTAPFLHNKQIVEKIKAQFKSGQAKNESHLPDQHLEKNKKAVSDQEANSKMVNSGLHAHGQDNIELRKTNTTVAMSNQPENGNKSGIFKSQIKEKQKDNIRGSFLMEPKRERGKRVSLDGRLVTNRSKLQEKISKLKKVNKEEDNDENSGSDEISKQKIKNINLPAADEKAKNDRQNEQIQVVPITRKLESKLYDNEEIQEIDSPLIRKKFNSKPKRQGNSQSPVIMPSPEPNHKDKPQKTNGLQFKLEKVKQTLPHLTESEQKSYMLLVASLKLEASAAIPLVEKALQQSNKNLSAAEYLSFLYLESCQFQKCLKICNYYLKMMGDREDLSSSRILFLNNKSAALNSLGRFSETVKILSACEPLNEMGLKNLGNAYYGLGFLDHAISLYRKYLEDNYDDEVYYNLGGCLYLIGEIEAAKMAIETALVSQPENVLYLDLQAQITAGK